MGPARWLLAVWPRVYPKAAEVSPVMFQNQHTRHGPILPSLSVSPWTGPSADRDGARLVAAGQGLQLESETERLYRERRKTTSGEPPTARTQTGGDQWRGRSVRAERAKQAE
jgi:hypothetical protein